MFNLSKLAARGTPKGYNIRLSVTCIHKKSCNVTTIIDSTTIFKAIAYKIKRTFFKPSILIKNNLN